MMNENDSAKAAGFDADMIRRAQKGERDAVRQLFGEHLATVQRFALRMCRDEDRARDVAQESLLTALKSLDSYRGDASFSTWLFTITRSHCGRARRRADREVVPEDETSSIDRAMSEAPAPDDQAAHSEVSDVVERALASLDPDDREVVLLRDVEGMSTKDAAQVLGLSVAALKSRLHRARTTLRSLVRQMVDAEPEVTPDGCPDILLEFSRKLEGDLSSDHCAQLEEHLASCPSCAARCRSIQVLLGACASLRASVPAADVGVIIDGTLAAMRSMQGVG
jgi:RNA polymerase sigma-70 factor (ECF subfamily)